MRYITWNQRLNYMYNLRKMLPQFRGLGLKTVAYTVLPIYWLILLVGTFLHWSWNIHLYTKLDFPPIKSRFTWSIHATPLSLLLAPRIVGLCACTLVIRSWSLWLLAWSLNPCAAVGMLVAWSLRACKLATSLPERSVIFRVMPCHINVYRNTRLVWTCPSTVCSSRSCSPVQGPGRFCLPGWWLSTSTART